MGVFSWPNAFSMVWGQDYTLARQLLEQMKWNYWEADY